MNVNKLIDTEYIKCVDLLDKLIDLDRDSKEKIHRCVQNMGIKNFFLHLKLMDLSMETCEKLESIQSIIELFDEEGGRHNYSKNVVDARTNTTVSQVMVFLHYH